MVFEGIGMVMPVLLGIVAAFLAAFLAKRTPKLVLDIINLVLLLFLAGMFFSAFGFVGLEEMVAKFEGLKWVILAAIGVQIGDTFGKWLPF